MSHATALNFDPKPVARAVAFPLSSTAEFPPLKLVLKPVTKACVSLLSSKVEFLPLKPFGLWSLHSHFCFGTFQFHTHFHSLHFLGFGFLRVKLSGLVFQEWSWNSWNLWWFSKHYNWVRTHFDALRKKVEFWSSKQSKNAFGLLTHFILHILIHN